MLDENLREEFADWLRPIREAEPPALPVIRGRLRLRRARNVTVGAVTLAAAAGIAVIVVAASGPAGTTVSSQQTPATVTSTIPTTIPTTQPSPIEGGYQVSSSYTISAPVSTLIVNSGLGEITVTGSQRSTVAVTEVMQYSEHPPAMARSLTGRTLTLGYTCPNETMCSASYNLQVPQGIAVRVSEGTGEITLSSLSGPVTATSQLGAVKATGLTSATASFSSGTGEIDATFTAVPMNVHATAMLGAINIFVPGTASYDVSTQASLGTVSVTVPEASSSPHAISATTGTGTISIAPTGAAGLKGPKHGTKQAWTASDAPYRASLLLARTPLLPAADWHRWR